jgi:hypothetical protein
MKINITNGFPESFMKIFISFDMITTLTSNIKPYRFRQQIKLIIDYIKNYFIFANQICTL